MAVPLPVGTGRDGVEPLLLPKENIVFFADGSDVLSSFFSSAGGAAPNEKAGLEEEEEASFFADDAVPAPNEKPVLVLAAAESSFFSSPAGAPKLKPIEVLLAALESSSLSRLRLGFAGVVAGIFVEEVPNEKPLLPIAAFFVVDGGALLPVPNENPPLPILADDFPSFSSPSSSLTRFALAGVALPKVLLPPPPLTVSTSFLFALLAAKRDSVLAKALAAGEGSDTADDLAVAPKENPPALIALPPELVAFFSSVLLFVTLSLLLPGLGASHDKQDVASLGFFV